ncbi:hypothetical protein PCASD_19593 [Puccinia coronata f. sp. avenae]|uniref:Uncharacterized protein n=1 Tax=Puccinia coronata f. sp. avenae TaxID=200324 RepID=A0A2N5TSB7_9BASI|nr:hypothetical protein PCASD_19964 [Puccinia coronata f. sp. avenae]PLW28395.1 hypothetical protein PCASD_19593 [Puccinia coronata f. sp. avenae]
MLGQFQGFYPIITLPSFVGVYPQPQLAQSQFYQEQATHFQPADSYKPNHSQSQSRTNNTGHPAPIQRARAANNAEINWGPGPDTQARMVELGDLADDLTNMRFEHVLAQ